MKNDKMTPEQLRELVSRGEDETLDFKQNQYLFEKAIDK